MFGYVEIVPIYKCKKNIYSLSRQGVAIKDKIYASKTPSSTTNTNMYS